jgi:septum formation protein
VIHANNSETTAPAPPAAGGIPVRGPKRPRLILASQSPRRRQLLSQHGLEHEARHPGLDDADLQPGSVAPQQWVAALAYLKAAAGLLSLRREGLPSPLVMIGADTACVKDGDLIGTPADAAEASAILHRLQDGEHDVVTGVALIEQDDPFAVPRRTLFADRARVRVGHIGEARIDEYIASGDWKGKAGGYNLLERIQAGWPISYTGDPTTVMGLPMQSLLPRLSELGKSA